LALSYFRCIKTFSSFPAAFFEYAEAKPSIIEGFSAKIWDTARFLNPGNKSSELGQYPVIHGRTTIRGPVIIGDHCEIGPDTYIRPYTSIGDHVRIANTEIENSIVMNGARIDCGKRVTDSLIGRKVQILNNENRLPKGHRLILGDQSTITL
jgi:NDP-sugar pyrophosphorylase family protein